MKKPKEKNEEKDILIENLLRELREKNNWEYINVVVKLSELGIMVNEKTIRKWESGLEYPELDVIYKLSEIYHISSEEFINAKNNSYKRGFSHIYQKTINIFCYITGASLKVGYFAINFIIFALLMYSIIYFTTMLNQVAEKWIRYR